MLRCSRRARARPTRWVGGGGWKGAPPRPHPKTEMVFPIDFTPLIHVNGFMRKLRLGRSGLVALVDDDEFAKASQFTWQAHPTKGPTYARTEFRVEGHRIRIFLHRLVMGLTAIDRSIECDHRNGDGLDCRRENLRTATRSENARNRAKRIVTPSSPYKGVRPKGTMWVAVISPNGRSILLGLYETAEDAARAYDAAAVEHFGEFARLNFPA